MNNDDFGDFQSATPIQSMVTTPPTTGHHKKHSTFANVPFAGIKLIICTIISTNNNHLPTNTHNQIPMDLMILLVLVWKKLNYIKK